MESINTWYVIGIALLVLGILMICFAAFAVMLIIAKKRSRSVRKPVILIICDIAALVCVSFFLSSHSTYYKYNDKIIIGSDISSVMEKYGEFDIGSVKQGRSGKAGYYIYTDDGPIIWHIIIGSITMKTELSTKLKIIPRRAGDKKMFLFEPDLTKTLINRFLFV